MTAMTKTINIMENNKDSKISDSNSSNNYNNYNNKRFSNSDRSCNWSYVLLTEDFLKLAFHNYE